MDERDLQLMPWKRDLMTDDELRSTISPLNAKKGPPVRDPEKGPSERAVGSRPLTGRNWDGR